MGQVKISKAFYWFSVSALVLNIFVILFGAFVRATGSGAGCGAHWPTCQGKIIPREPVLATVIEFTHRVTSGMALLVVLFMAVWAIRTFKWEHPVAKASAASLFFILIEAGIGAALVLFSLVGDNDSLTRAWVMGGHLINTLFLVAALSTVSLLSYQHHNGPLGWQDKFKSPHSRYSALGLLGFLVVAGTGGIAALGDTLFPATSLAHGFSQDFSTEAHVLLQLRVFHPLMAVALAAYWIFLVIFYRRKEFPIRTGWFRGRLHGSIVLWTLCAQVLLGFTNLLLLAPVYMQLIHLAMADLCFIAAFFYWTSTYGATESGTTERYEKVTQPLLKHDQLAVAE